MKSSVLRTVAKVFVVLMVMTVFASCNKRGSGCPDAFKIDVKSLPVIICNN